MSVLDTIINTVIPVAGVVRDTKENLVGNNQITSEFRREVVISVLTTFLLIVLFQILPVMLIAVNCNPKSPVTYGIIAFLFPGVYLFQHAVRKYLIKQKGYCGN
jgi:hypothetical protein